MTATRSTDDQQRGGSAVILFCDKSAYEFLAAITALLLAGPHRSFSVIG